VFFLQRNHHQALAKLLVLLQALFLVQARRRRERKHPVKLLVNLLA